MKKICKHLKEHAMKIIYCEKKEMIPLTHEENDSYENQSVCHTCQKEFIFGIARCSENMYSKYRRHRDHIHYTGKHRGAVHNICNLRYKTPKEIPTVFHNGSTYDFHFVIQELTKEYEGQFECLGKIVKKYITFSVPIKKKLDNDQSVTYKLKFIDGFRFMSTSLSILVNNLSEALYNDKCIGYKSYLDYMSINDDGTQLILRCFKCKMNCTKNSNKEPTTSFSSTYKFCDEDINKFILFLRKVVHLYEYMGSWERFYEINNIFIVS